MPWQPKCGPIPPSPLDKFFHNGSRCEDLLRYVKNGYHPIIPGDILPKLQTCVSDESMQPRYRILWKLGNGAFATVWLARDLVQKLVIHLILAPPKPTLTQAYLGEMLPSKLAAAATARNKPPKRTSWVGSGIMVGSILGTSVSLNSISHSSSKGPMDSTNVLLQRL